MQTGVLLRQATIRVVTISLVMVATIALLALGFQHQTMGKAADRMMRSLRSFYTEKIVLLEQEWQEEAIILHNRLEMYNLFREPDKGWERLRDTLVLEANSRFPVILVTDGHQRILFQYTTSPLTLADRFVTAKPSGWYEHPASGQLYRWIAQPLWLGVMGHGELVVFVPIENGLLFRHTLPLTDLFVLYHNHIKASSVGNNVPGVETLQEGTFREGKNRLDQISIPWGDVADQELRMVIRHHSQPIFSVMEIFLAGISILLLLSLLFWKTLGVWLVSLTRRITTLGLVAQEFSRGYHLTDTMKSRLTSVALAGRDEVTSVANAMVLATESVEKELLERRRAQATLQRISSHNKLLLEAAGEGIYGMDKEGRTTFINPAAARMLGWEPGELLGQYIHDFMHHTRPDNAPYPRDDCLVAKAILDGEIQHVTNELFWRKDLSSFFVEYTSTPIVDNGEILGAVVVFRDISERLQAENQAQHYLTFQRIVNGLYAISYARIPLREQLERALDFILSVPWLAIQSKGVVFLVHPETDSLQLVAQKGLNPELIALCDKVPFGHCLCGRAAVAKTIIHADCVDDRHDIAFDGMLPHGHYSVPILSGSLLLGVLTFYLESGQGGNPEEESLLLAIGNTLGSLIERKKLEESLQHHNLILEEKVQERTMELEGHLASLKSAQTQLIQSERLAALGGLVAGISHEIKTPVGIGFTAVTYLESETGKFLDTYRQGSLRREDLDHFLDNIHEATQLIKANLKRASDLILSFKKVAVDQTSQEKRIFNLKEYLEETVFTLRPKLKKTQHEVLITCPEDIELNSYPGALSQIIANFIINSLNYAFDETASGKMGITAGHNHDTLFLHYADNGKGMDKETLKQIYEPFFTTNRNQGGSGLGMHIVYNLVTQRLNGTIECFSQPGEGTEFRIQFPKVS
ncbi:MAG: PAS domain S-box protein [Magnetococcales bacterium]|nr:PAS domain S-box protein [Magnetococcales bacterium]